MRNAVNLFLVLLIFSSCAPKGEVPEIVMEDGVEMVLNRLEPYTIKGEATTFTLLKEFTIDTENDRIAETGLTDIGLNFDVDSQGNIYLAGYENTEGMIFKFDREGNFVRSFGRKGQGPGELQGRNYVSLYLSVDQNDNIAVSDFGNKLAVFNGDGRLLTERKIDRDTICIAPLSNGNYLSYIRVMDGGSEFINQNPLTLIDSQHKKIKELDKQMVPNPIIGKKLKGSYHVLSWSIANGKIFTGFQERGYKISVFDFDGNLVRKIKKEFVPVPISEEYKTAFMAQFNAPIFDDIRSKIYFPDAMPAFHSLFADEKGRLFVMTHESGENPGEFMHDIFNPDGVCIGRTSLKVLHDESGMYAKMKNGRFYCLNEKDSGYKELIVSKVIWDKNSEKEDLFPSVSSETFSEENVKIISNTAEGLSGKDKQISLEEELIIGKEYGDDEEMFGYIRVIDFDSENNIFVADSLELTVKVFDEQGRFIKSFGREGGGPGEFETIDDFHWCSFDSLLYIPDRRNNRINQFSRDGKFIKAFKTTNFKIRVQRIDSFEDGKFMISGMRFGGNFADYRIIVADHSFENIIAEYGEDFPIHSIGMDYFPNFSDVGIISDTQLYYTSPSEYKIVLFDRNLAKSKIIKKNHPKMFVPQYVNGFYSDFNGLENMSVVNGNYIVGVSYSNAAEIPLFKQKKEFINFVDNENESSYQLDIFNGDLQFLTSINIPPQRRLAGIDNKNRLYFIENEPFPRLIRCVLKTE